jgi:hypothetical protein
VDALQPVVRTNSALTVFERLSILALLSYAVREPFVGAVQFYLNQLNLGVLWFVPDIMGFVCIGAILAVELTQAGSLKFAFIIIVIFYYMLLGYISIGSFASSLSGFKALLPLFVGLTLTERVLQRRSIRLTLVLLLLLAIAGLWYSAYNELPWAGLNFDSGIGESRTFKSIQWAGSTGAYRPFGFSGDQHYAGSSILFLLALIGVSNRRALFYALCLPAGAAIYISTSRTSLLAFLLLVALCFTFDVLEKRTRPGLTALVAAALPFFTIVAPVTIMIFAQMYSGNDVPGELFSLWVRGHDVFLQPFALMPVFAPNAWLFGFGLGGVGFPVRQSAYSSYEAIIDNFLLFSYYSFGIPFLLFYFGMCVRNCYESDIYKRILFCVTVIFGQFILGWANGMFMLVFGYAASSSFLRGRAVVVPKPATKLSLIA